MSNIVQVTHTVKGKAHTHRVRVETDDPALAKDEITANLAEQFRCDKNDIQILSVGPDPITTPPKGQTAAPGAPPAPAAPVATDPQAQAAGDAPTDGQAANQSTPPKAAAKK